MDGSRRLLYGAGQELDLEVFVKHALARLCFVTILAVLAAAAAGCGGGDDDDGDAAGDQAAATATLGDDASETTEADTGEGEVDASEAVLDEDCVELAQLGSSVFGALGGGQGVSNPEEYSKFLEEFADRTPDEIRDDFRLVADAYVKIVEALGDAQVGAGGTPDPEALERLRQVSEELDQDALNEAAENINAWVEEHCR